MSTKQEQLDKFLAELQQLLANYNATIVADLNHDVVVLIDPLSSDRAEAVFPILNRNINK
jgi:hypothetical protein